ncbi:MAG: M23 family metallopeptidase [Patescibacteria group bacterium]
MYLPAHIGVIALALILVAPVPTHAATVYDNDRSYFSREEYRSSSSRLSSSLRNKIKKLDDDAVENLPIPIALGVALRNLSKNFGDDRDGGARSHEGLDIMAPRGAYIASPTEAVVTRTGKGSSAGTYVYTMGPGGETFAYMHLDGIADGIKSGSELKAGDLIGYVGDTGNAKGGATHLHFEIREGRKATDPFPRLTREFTSAELIRTLTDVVEELQADLKRKD